METLGLIAGSGQLPFELARAARRAGFRLAAVGHRGETDERLLAEVDALHWVRLGQLKKIATALEGEGVKRAVFAGALKKQAGFTSVRPDLAVLKILATLEGKGDDRLLKAFAQWFAEQGIEIVGPRGLLPDCFAPEGPIAGPAPTDSQMRDARQGLALCRLLGQGDVGQSVVVREGVVLAVEALEGTDACIRRAGTLAPKAVAVKALKPMQDQRFDLPAVGPATLEVLAEAKGSALALEAGSTLLIDRQAMAAAAKRHRIAVFGLV
jgi:UDP-2,3-diacylglucosamine hydrolase